MSTEAFDPISEEISDLDSPLTIIREMTVKPGKEAEFEIQISNLIHEAVKQPGHLGTTVVKPTHPGAPYQVIYKFSRRSLLEAWHESELRGSLMEPILPLTISDRFDTFDGLETWFDVPKAGGPPRWKTTFVSWTAIFPTAIFYSTLIVGSNIPFHWVTRVFILTIFTVPTAAYFTGPLAFRFWHRWLNPSKPPK